MYFHISSIHGIDIPLGMIKMSFHHLNMCIFKCCLNIFMQLWNKLFIEDQSPLLSFLYKLFPILWWSTIPSNFLQMIQLTPIAWKSFCHACFFPPLTYSLNCKLCECTPMLPLSYWSFHLDFAKPPQNLLVLDIMTIFLPISCL